MYPSLLLAANFLFLLHILVLLFFLPLLLPLSIPLLLLALVFDDDVTLDALDDLLPVDEYLEVCLLADFLEFPVHSRIPFVELVRVDLVDLLDDRGLSCGGEALLQQAYLFP
jgi:hypothetical protein